MTTGSRKPGVFVKTAHHENNNDDKNNDNNNNKKLQQTTKNTFGPVTHFLDDNPSKFKFFGQFVLLWFKFSWCQLTSLQFLHMTSIIVWHETHICCQGMRKICSDDQKMKYDKRNFNHAGNVHYSDVIMSAMASQITDVLIVCLNVCSVADQRKHQSSMSLAFVRGIHWWQVNSPHKVPVTRKMFPFDDVIMEWKSSGDMGPRTLRQPNLRKVDLPYRGKAEMKAL